jgi:hypothetical protein
VGKEKHWELHNYVKTRIIKRRIRRISIRFAALALLLCFDLYVSYSQPNGVAFSHVDVNSGMSDNAVKCILRDSRGFVWFGTYSGLNRFDGYRFEVFRNSSGDTSSIAEIIQHSGIRDRQSEVGRQVDAKSY